MFKRCNTACKVCQCIFTLLQVNEFFSVSELSSGNLLQRGEPGVCDLSGRQLSGSGGPGTVLLLERCEPGVSDLSGRQLSGSRGQGTV